MKIRLTKPCLTKADAWDELGKNVWRGRLPHPLTKDVLLALKKWPSMFRISDSVCQCAGIRIRTDIGLACSVTSLI